MKILFVSLIIALIIAIIYKHESQYILIEKEPFKERISTSLYSWSYIKSDNKYFYFHCTTNTKGYERKWYIFLDLIGLRNGFKVKSIFKVKIKKNDIKLREVDNNSIDGDNIYIYGVKYNGELDMVKYKIIF